MPELANLRLQKEKRPYQSFENGSFQSERKFLDFVVDGISLCRSEGLDNISCIWLPDVYKPAVKRLLLQEPADFPDGRVSLYVCAECGGIDCGAVSVRITQRDNIVIWSDFAYQNDYDKAMTHQLDSFFTIDPISFKINDYRNLLIPLINEVTCSVANIMGKVNGVGCTREP
jgi:hypothetical protein